MAPKRHTGKLIALAIVVIALLYSYSWTYTPHGRLDYRAAVSLHALTFNHSYTPDPDFDLHINLPVNLAFSLDMLLPEIPVARTEDVLITSDNRQIPARVYWPKGFDDNTDYPLIVYFHGGGFMLGSVDIFDPLARKLTNATNSILVSVDYRLTPAHPYPAAIDDGMAALSWAAQQASKLGGDASKLVVAGDSAGGNMSAVIAIRARDEGGPALAAQVLYYPAVDLTDKHYASYDKYDKGYAVTREMADVFNHAYVGQLADKAIAWVSPLYAESLQGLPPALVITAGHDLLTDPTLLYIDRLRHSGVDVTAVHYATTIHGFMSVSLFSEQRLGLRATDAFLRRVLN